MSALSAAALRLVFGRAAQYDRANPLLVVERPETEALLPDARGLDVLDLGAGHAHYARRAHAQGARRAIALDLSEGMLRRSGVTAIAADAAALPLAADRFDLVVAALVLSYVDRAPALAEIARVLRPGGWLVLSDLHAEGAQACGWQRTFRTAAAESVSVDAPPPAPSVLRDEVEGAGLAVAAVRETLVDERLEPHFRDAGRRDFAALRGVPLLLHIVARKGGAHA